MKRRVTCHCEQKIDFDTPEVYDAAPGSPTREAIVDGTFLTITCDRCGEEIRPELEATLHDGERTVVLVPEARRNSFLLGALRIPKDAAVVVGFGELRERMIVLDAGLRVDVVEALKYQILRKAGPRTDLRIFCVESTSNELVFHIHGLRDDDEVAVMRVPRSAYDRATADMRLKANEEPYRTILSPPYVSINKIELDPEEASDDG